MSLGTRVRDAMTHARRTAWPSPLRLMAAALTLALMTSAGNGNQPTVGERGLPQRERAAPDDIGRVIVKYREDGSLMRSAQASRVRHGQPLHAATLQWETGLALTDGRVLGRRMQSLRARGIGSTALAERLRQHPEVEWAVVDERRYVKALTNDPLLPGGQPAGTPAVGQWYLRAPNATEVSAINAVDAWDVTTGSAAITVAVLDTGVRPHPELIAKRHPGYDFIHSDTVSNDGTVGRDADATDPGDFELSTSCGNGVASDSSWHGTQVAGLIGAATNDGIGMAGVGRNVMILPVRVLGRCGGFDSDIIAAMRWAGGVSSEVGAGGASLTVVNANPARVINMSLGSPGTCPASYASVISELGQAGVTVVASAGNDNGLSVNTPANCPGAIAVAGLRHTGTKVGYSSVGPQAAIAAPAGNCVNVGGTCLYPLLTTTNSGLTTPLAETYSDGANPTLGTSFAAPLVAGTVGLMLSVNPTMVPAQVRAALQSSASAFPTTGAAPGTPTCRAPDGFTQIECYCTTATCGAGMLNAALAVVHALNPFVQIAASSTSPGPGTTVTLDGSASAAQAGRTITGYQWSLVSGATLASFSGTTNGSSASLRVSSTGSVTADLAVTDSTGVVAHGTITLTVATPPAGGSGGGAIGILEAAGVALLAIGLALRRRPRAAFRAEAISGRTRLKSILLDRR